MAESITETIVAPEPTLHMKLGNGIAPQPPKVKSKSNNNNAMRTRNLRLDPSRALEPAKKKLSTIESQRIMAVVEETIKRVEVVTAIPYIMSNIERFRVSLGSELYDVLKQHYQIQENYKDIRESLDALLDSRAKALERQTLKDQEEAAEEEFDDAEESEFDEGSFIDETTNLESENVTIADKTEKEDTTVDEKHETDETIENSVNQNESAKRTAGNVQRMMTSDTDIADLEPRIEETMRTLGLVAQQVNYFLCNLYIILTCPLIFYALKYKAQLQHHVFCCFV